MYIFILLTILYDIKISKYNEFNHNVLSLKSSNSIKGLAAIIVVIHHVTQRMYDPGVLFIFRRIGYLPVSLFLFYSGYGLMKSYNSKENYLDNFLLTRLPRIIIPFILSNIIFIIVDIYQGKIFSLNEILMYTLGIKLIDGIKWYVIVIIMLYVSFYVSFKYLHKTNAIINIFCITIVYIMLCKLIGIGAWWYNTIHNFGLGILVAQYYTQIIDIISKKHTMLIICLFLLFTLMFRFNMFTGLSSTVFILLYICISVKVEVGNSIMYKFGGISYEIYLIHMLVLNSLKISNESIYLLVSIILSIILAYVLKILTIKVLKYYENISKSKNLTSI